MKSKRATGNWQPATGNRPISDPALPVACCQLPFFVRYRSAADVATEALAGAEADLDSVRRG
jgi:hypothetical protein